MTVHDNTTITVDATEELSNSTNSTSCLVCDMNSLQWYSNIPKICDDCRRAIMFIKERFKGEYDA